MAENPTFAEAMTGSDPDALAGWHLQCMTPDEAIQAEIYERLVNRCMAKLKADKIDPWEIGIAATNRLLETMITELICREN